MRHQKRSIRLSASFVRTVTRPGRYGDGRGGFGLSLLVKPNSVGGFSRSWSQRVRIGDKPVSIGLGSYPLVTLAEAREQAFLNRRKIAKGGDPREKRRSVPTFAESAEQVIRIHAKAWKNDGKSEHQWRSSLETYAFPKLGNMPVNRIRPKDVMNALLLIWTAKPVTAKRVRQRIGAVMNWAVAQGYRTDNPAGETLGAALPKQENGQEHLRALPFAQVANALRKVRASDDNPTAALCLEFLTVCAVRSGEARLARWDEIDADSATWTIPASRMKAKRAHRVPLSTRALEVLEVAQEYRKGSDCLFPSRGGKPLSPPVLSRLCKRLNLGCVPHGMRSSFRDWCAECTDAPREVCELALAHVNSDRVEAAYRRTDLFERRRELMEEWAQYLENS